MAIAFATIVSGLHLIIFFLKKINGNDFNFLTQLLIWFFLRLDGAFHCPDQRRPEQKDQMHGA